MSQQLQLMSIRQYGMQTRVWFTKAYKGSGHSQMKQDNSQHFIAFSCQVTLPTAMLTFVSHMMSNFMEEYFEMVVQVNLTAMLVIATL